MHDLNGMGRSHMVLALIPACKLVMSPMRHFILMRIGLSTLLVVLAMPLHAERFHGEKAASHVHDAGPGTPGHRIASAATKRKDPRTALAALGVERRGEVKNQAKPKNTTKRKPAEKAVVAGREGALARPTGLCAMVIRGVPHVRLRPPVHGVVAKRWGEATDAGPATGMFYQASSGARVVAPCGGRVVFANSFRSYGQLLIVDCGGGYHMILSGLEKLDVQSGQTIGAGKIVGVMPLSEPGSTMRQQTLYIELRHNGHPVDPTPWLRSSG